MSINSYIFLCLICLSSHACIARPLAMQVSNKKNEKDNFMRISVLPNAQPSFKKHEVDEKHIRAKENKDDEEYNKKFDSKAGAKELNRQRLTMTGANLQAEPLVSVAWRVPHKKRGKQQPGFNLDYSPPKTHPPVHN